MRSTSAPDLSMISCGAVTLPRDFDCFLPSPSTTQPCVTICLYGAESCAAMPQLKDELNQPRYWSPPSRYTSAGNRSVSPRVSKTATHDEPESNHTSRMSVSFLKSGLSHFAHL